LAILQNNVYRLKRLVMKYLQTTCNCKYGMQPVVFPKPGNTTYKNTTQFWWSSTDSVNFLLIISTRGWFQVRFKIQKLHCLFKTGLKNINILQINVEMPILKFVQHIQLTKTVWQHLKCGKTYHKEQ